MLLAIDIGNTNCSFALCTQNAIVHQWRIATDMHRTKDEYAVWLLALFQLHGLNASAVSAAIISSVVPDVNFAIKRLVRDYMHIEPVVVDNGAVDCGMKVHIEQPRELGADRIINAFAAWSLYHESCIVVDFGTATTFDVISPKGEYLGGSIAPGINLSLEALKRAASKLHGVAIVHTQKAIGVNTTEAMQSGIYFGYAGMIEGIITKIRQELGAPAKVVATGGLAPLYADATNAIDEVNEDITITGLRLLHARLTQKKAA